MPNYQLLQSRLDQYNRAAQVLPQLQAIYSQCQAVTGAIADYQATDGSADYKQAIDSIFTASERQQLGTMLTQIAQLVAAWSANHAALLGTDGEAG